MDDPAHQESIVNRIAKLAPDAGARETILNIFKAVLATAPFGGGLASLITDYIPSARSQRIETFAEQTAQDLERLQAQVDQEYLTTQEFAFIFEKCFRGAAEYPQQEKLRAFRAILINAATGKVADEQEKEYFLNLVNTLTVLHIRILRFLHQPEKYLTEIGVPLDSIRGGFAQMFTTAVPDTRLDVIKAAFGDLHRAGLINTDASIFSTMTSAQGLQLLGGRVSDLGASFVEFCSL